MAQAKVDKEMQKAIHDARNVVRDAEKADCNEAETRRRIERIFENVMGYDALKHLSRERAVRGAGETEHVDFSIDMEEGGERKPIIFVEIKRVNIDLATKHLKQVSSYAINAGCEWILLTNARDWSLYHISFGQPPDIKKIFSWNLLTDEMAVLAERFELISFKSVKKGSLDEIWEKTNVLSSKSLLEAILSEDSLMAVRREIRKNSGVMLAPEEIVTGIRRLLNENTLNELENIRISLRKQQKKKVVKVKDKGEEEPRSPEETQDVASSVGEIAVAEGSDSKNA